MSVPILNNFYNETSTEEMKPRNEENVDLIVSKNLDEYPNHCCALRNQKILPIV